MIVDDPMPIVSQVWDGVRNSMMKMQKAGAGSLKLDDMKKAVAENMDTFKASLSNMKVWETFDVLTSTCRFSYSLCPLESDLHNLLEGTY